MVVENNYITVLPAPSISFTAATTCDSPRANVVLTPTVGNGATNIQWQFGDNGAVTETTPGTVDTVMHTYAIDGLFDITATTTNGTCSASAEESVVIELKPLDFHLGVNVTTICPATFITDTLQQTLPAGNPYDDGYAYYNLQWYYADGTPFLGPQNWVNIPYLYGNYTSMLSGFQSGERGLYAVTTNAAGCKDTTNIVPLIVGGVTAAYQVIQDDQCYQQPVILQDMSQAAPGDPIVELALGFRGRHHVDCFGYGPAHLCQPGYVYGDANGDGSGRMHIELDFVQPGHGQWAKGELRNGVWLADLPAKLEHLLHQHQ